MLLQLKFQKILKTIYKIKLIFQLIKKFKIN